MPKTVCLDFDGVIHSYTSPWTVPEEIPDPPVENALPRIREYLDAGLEVYIQTTRAKSQEAAKAMFDWLMKHGLEKHYVEKIIITSNKPMAVRYVDDRGFHFVGIFPTVEEINNFKPWNR